MKERVLAYAAFIVAALFLGGIGSWIPLEQKSPAGFRIATVDRAKLAAGGFGADAIRGAVACVAARQGYSLVLDKEKVVGSAGDLTDAVAEFIRSGAPASFTAAPLPSPVGVIDQDKVFSLPQFQKARARYAKLFANLKAGYREKVKQGLSPSALAALKSHYNAMLDGYQKTQVDPLVQSVERSVKEIGAERGLSLIFDSKDVLYGGTDITSIVLRNASDSSGGSAVPAEAQPASDGQAISLGVVDLNKLVPLSPSFSRLVELDREIASWKAGRYGIAETLLSPADAAEWDRDRAHAESEWNGEMSRLSSGTGASAPQASAPSGSSMQQAETYFNEAYRAEMKHEADSLQKKYQDYIHAQENEVTRDLKAYGERLFADRNRSLHAEQDKLLKQAEVKLQTRAAELQQEYEKEPAATRDSKKKEIDQQFMAYRNDQLKDVKSDLDSMAQMLDQDALPKMKAYRAARIDASRKAVAGEQGELKGEMDAYQRTAYAKAKAETARKFGGAASAMERQTELDGKMMSARSRIDAELQNEEQSLLARSPQYRKTLAAIRHGDAKAASDVIQSLEKEKGELLQAVRLQLAARASTAAARKGITTVLTGALIDVSAPDLTADIAGTQ